MYYAVVGATKGKGALRDLSGPRNMLRRIGVITRRYGVKADKMQHTLDRFAEILERFDCGATFPITVQALVRNLGAIQSYQARNVELAAHGYTHVDHTRLPLEEKVRQLRKARALCEERGVFSVGFRCPYLRWDASTVAAIHESGYLYDSSQALSWSLASHASTGAYEHVLRFYGAISATDHPALPRLEDGLVRIPYCLPDDEAVVDRLALGPADMTREWLTILRRTHELGELFTLGLHPERVRPCETSLVETLRAARAMSPAVWIARLDEIARWWIARAGAVVTAAQGEDGELSLGVDGPEGTTILARGVEVMAPTSLWDGAYRRVHGTRVRLRADRRPFIGVSPSSSPRLTSFLRQQGYVVEPANAAGAHAIYLHQPHFGHEDERALLAEVELGAHSLVRLGRWPRGAKSALCVTGDIDALTVYDYGLRLLGR